MKRFYLTGVGLFLVDQIIKEIALRNNFKVYKNFGSFAFGLFPSNVFIPHILYFLFGFLLLLYWRRRGLNKLALSFYFSAASTHLFDRIYRGFVVDYLPIFNLTNIDLGDTYIIASFLFLSYDILKKSK